MKLFPQPVAGRGLGLFAYLYLTRLKMAILFTISMCHTISLLMQFVKSEISKLARKNQSMLRNVNSLKIFTNDQ
jgi:hypothetical protein